MQRYKVWVCIITQRGAEVQSSGLYYYTAWYSSIKRAFVLLHSVAKDIKFGFVLLDNVVQRYKSWVGIITKRGAEV